MSARELWRKAVWSQEACLGPGVLISKWKRSHFPLSFNEGQLERIQHRWDQPPYEYVAAEGINECAK